VPVLVDQPRAIPPSPKKLKTGAQDNMQMEVYGSKGHDGNQKKVQPADIPLQTPMDSVSIPLGRSVGTMSAPSKLITLETKGKNGKVSSFKADSDELSVLNAGGDRVQGLSGEDINDYEEDFLSEETQGSQSNPKEGKDSVSETTAKCADAEVVLNYQEQLVETISELKGKTDKTKTNSGLNAQGLHDEQLIPEIRFSNRIQDQLLNKKDNQDSKKKVMEGNSVLASNSFAMLDNDLIVNLAADMGIAISVNDFDTVELMKDLELARSALDKTRKLETQTNLPNSEIPLLEWIDEDSETEHFTLVMSKKKKRKKQSPMNVEKSVKVEPVRRSKKIAPSLYKNK
jgi:hypothetical protein